MWVFWARKLMRRFVRESLRFAHRGAPRHPDSTGLPRDIVRPFVRKKCKPPPRKSDVIFVDPMGCTFTRQQGFRHGVDEHPNFGP